MTEIEHTYFSALTLRRQKLADALEDPAAKGIWSRVVGIYSDQAHFVYELLQNADDSKATDATFILSRDKLVFIHNGTKNFSISNPETEDADSKNGWLGDINAITSVGNSNKNDNENTIGKFGMGFKAVFDYTDTPYIYDDNVHFKIERRIVPHILIEDCPQRSKGETAFVFPFDKDGMETQKCFEDIKLKLKNLVFPSLFLSNLRTVTYNIDGQSGSYKKTVLKTYSFEGIDSRLVDYDGKRIYLFSRKYKDSLDYTVAFFVGLDGKLESVNYPAFCYFQTQQQTGLDFVIHAPFLLTPNREGIKAGKQENEELINLLAVLSADSLVCLKDIDSKLINDDILDIIPYDESKFPAEDGNNKISYKPFYNVIKEKLSKEELLPGKGCFAKKENAFFADVPEIAELFSDSQLGQMVNNPDVHWVFTSIGRGSLQRSNAKMAQYIDEITCSYVDENILLKGRRAIYPVSGITKEFIENQSISWLYSFYNWINKTDVRCRIAKELPFILNQDGKAVKIFDCYGNAILFFPTEGIDGYNTVNEKLLDYIPDVKANDDFTVKAFLKKIGVSQPSAKDEIYNKIIPQYKNGNEISEENQKKYFDKFFKYFLECPHEKISEYIAQIKQCKFLKAIDLTGQISWGKAEDLYIPYEELKVYFSVKPEIKFLDYEFYKNIYTNNNQLDEFINLLDLNSIPRLFIAEISFAEALNRKLPMYSAKSQNWQEYRIDGAKEAYEIILKGNENSKEISCLLWNQLTKIVYNERKTISEILIGEYKYVPSGNGKYQYTVKFDSKELINIRNAKWLVSNKDNFVSPKEITKEELNDCYDIESQEARGLISSLPFKKKTDLTVNLTKEQKDILNFARQCQEAGIKTSDDLKEFMEWKAARAQRILKPRGDDSDSAADTTQEEDAYKSPLEKEFQKIANIAKEKISSVVHYAFDIDKTNSINSGITEEISDEMDDDTDGIMPSAVDFSRQIKRAEQKNADEIARITKCDELQNKAINSEKYSFSWFYSLLQLEEINNGKNNSNTRQIFLSFTKAEREQGAEHTIILSNADKGIPQFVEDLTDIPLLFDFGEEKKQIIAEAFSVKSYTLKAKLRSDSDIDDINFSKVKEILLQTKSPSFLLEELIKKFYLLAQERNWNDKFNLQSNLTDKMRFIFGPPGTGKTTYLANKEILSKISSNENIRILVLAPTNKAADVLTCRIMDNDLSESYKDWLIRFGSTSDEEIEKAGIHKDKTFNITLQEKAVVITTIARFPYDYFIVGNTRIFLDGLNWNYIIFDEASMIPLINMIYPLYKKTPKEFIIAGDPFQIQPIVSVDMWQDENIYSMVGLNSFSNCKTVPHNYKIISLNTQYRSLTVIGEVFSKFAYDGKLQHFRAQTSSKKIDLPGISLESLNIIHFPVSKYEGIYRAKKLNNSSSYQIYSVLLTYELVLYIANNLSLKDKQDNHPITIGVIAPYKAESDLIQKLVSSENLPQGIQIQLGTIHGFQGDECDIVLAVFNSPPNISDGKKMFLNKLNIINVAISRARDCLIVLTPEKQTENIGKLKLVNKLEKLITQQAKHKLLYGHEIEETIFGDPMYIEKNSFSTSHQSVNIYTKPECRYEIRTEDTAVDIQIHKTSETNGISNESENEFLDKGKNDDYINSYQLKEELIPEELRKTAIDIPARGAIKGWCYLVPYEGKVKEHTLKKTEVMFIPLMRNGQEKMVTVSVVKEDRIIYISKEMFKLYEQGLSEVDGIELRKKF